MKIKLFKHLIIWLILCVIAGILVITNHNSKPTNWHGIVYDTTIVNRGSCYAEWWIYKFDLSYYYNKLYWNVLQDTTISGFGCHEDTIWIYYNHYNYDTMYICPIEKPKFCDEPSNIEPLSFLWYGEFCEIDTIMFNYTDTDTISINHFYMDSITGFDINN